MDLTAKATIINREPTVELHVSMTLTEAEALLCLCEHISGDRVTTPRAVADRIGDALRNAGVPITKWPRCWFRARPRDIKMLSQPELE